MNPDLPARIAALPRDRRGYPIPYIVFRGADGVPEFVVNDTGLVLVAILGNLCHVCGQELEPNPWFCGGPGNALANGDRAIYKDGPMHRECMEYSLQVCPHLSNQLAGPVNLKPITRRLNRQGKGTVDPTVVPGIPPVFCAVQAYRYEHDGRYFHVAKPYKKLHFWQGGRLMDRQEGEREAKRHARTMPTR